MAHLRAGLLLQFLDVAHANPPLQLLSTLFNHFCQNRFIRLTSLVGLSNNLFRYCVNLNGVILLRDRFFVCVDFRVSVHFLSFVLLMVVIVDWVGVDVFMRGPIFHTF